MDGLNVPKWTAQQVLDDVFYNKVPIPYCQYGIRADFLYELNVFNLKFDFKEFSEAYP